ncbi:MAG: ABC transporter permease subunit [Candidatus Latescibacterota bacterium]|jgi:ABC-type transport system involved in multi-copper enzyme maturation permease subunit
MLHALVHKELLELLGSLRFAVGGALLLSLFVAGALAWNVRYLEQTAAWQAGEREAATELANLARGGVFSLAWGTQVWCPPSAAGFLSDGNGRGIPNVARVGAFQLENLEQAGDRNPLLFRRELDWVFTIGLAGSLLALLLTYDAVAGEKERGSLKQVLANRVPRVTVLWAKFLATMVAVTAPVLVGAVAAGGIMALGSPTGLPLSLWLPTGAVLAGGILCLSAFAWLGLLVSSRSTSSPVALLVLLVAWVFLVVLLPSSGGLIGNSLAPVSRAGEVQRRVQTVWQSMKNGPEQMAALRAVYADHWRQLVRQLEVAQAGVQLSPTAAYRYLSEALAGTGVGRFRAFLVQAEQHRATLHRFVEDEDAADPTSTHRLIPGHWGTISSRPVPVERVPQFHFREATWPERLGQATPGLVVLLLANLVCLGGAFWSFRRYDVR